MTRWTFDAIREKRGEPIAVFEISAHLERTMESFSINPDPSKVAVWKISDEFEGGIIIYCTWGDGKDAEWHPNSGHRQLVTHLLADRDRLRSELDAARAELARVRAAASGVFAYLDARASFGSGNAPGHAHTRPGIWDDDNGAKSGTECEWCKTWNTFRAELARMGEP